MYTAGMAGVATRIQLMWEERETLEGWVRKPTMEHRRVQRARMNLEAAAGILFNQPLLPYPLKDPGGPPLLKPEMHGAGGGEALGQGLPLAPGAQHVEDAVHTLAGWGIWATSLGIGTFLEQQRLDTLPQAIRETPSVVYRFSCELNHCLPL